MRALRGSTEKPNPKGYACSFRTRIGFWIRWRNSRTDSLFRLQHHHRYCHWLRFAGCRLDHCQSHQDRFARYRWAPLSSGCRSAHLRGRLHGGHSNLSFSGHQAKSPKSSAKATCSLRQFWPCYCKPGWFAALRQRSFKAGFDRRAANESFQGLRDPCASRPRLTVSRTRKSCQRCARPHYSFRRYEHCLAPCGWTQNRYPRPVCGRRTSAADCNLDLLRIAGRSCPPLTLNQSATAITAAPPCRSASWLAINVTRSSIARNLSASQRALRLSRRKNNFFPLAKNG